MIDFADVCSGISAPAVALHPLGWRSVWHAEIEAFPSAVLAHRYPDVPNHGDMTTLPARVLSGTIAAPSVLIGGTPCQAFSVAGMRAGMADPRGLLTIRFVELADAIDHVRTRAGQPECVVWWENVPGVLSDKENAFGCFLAALVGESEPLVPSGGKWTDAGCVYGPTRAVAWRVLDAQYFGLAQRRRRVFVVASARNGFDPARVLFESEGLRRDSAPRRTAGEGTSGGAAAGAGGGGWPADVAATLNVAFGDKQGLEDQHALAGASWFVPDVVGTLTAKGPEAMGSPEVDGHHYVPLAFSCKDHGADAGELSPTLRAMGHAGSHANAGGQVAVAFHPTQDPISSTDGTTHCMGTGSSGGCATVAVAITGQITHALNTANNGKGSSEDGTGRGVPTIAAGMAVRRLTPRECERLQGFPDDFTLIPWRGKPAQDCPDGPRYKALGNSMAVPCMAWIGRRITDAINQDTP